MSDAQNELLLKALERGPMTAMDILRELGIARASARVFDLRQAGYDVRSRQVQVKNRHGKKCHVAEYSLVSQQRTLMDLHPGRGFMSGAAQAQAGAR